MRLLTFAVECVTVADRNAVTLLTPSHSRSWGQDVASDVVSDPAKDFLGCFTDSLPSL